MQYGFYFDSSRCTGCKTCELACKDFKDLSADILYRRVYDFEGGAWSQADGGAWTTTAFSYHVSESCNHCAAPACVAACPTGAIVKNAETGLVTINAEACNGTGTCVSACPYGAPRLDASSNKAVKCDACAERVATGSKPICVEACPLRALDFGDIAQLRAKYGELAQVPPLPAPDQTAPSLTIKAAPAVSSPVITSGIIANEREVA